MRRFGCGSVFELSGAGTPLSENPQTSDFNADGKSDILWQNSDGQAAIWLMNGTTPTAEALVGANPGTSWQVVGAGDFYGSLYSDILWQNTDGAVSIWEMNGTTVVASGSPGNPGTELARGRHRRFQRRRLFRHPVAEHQWRRRDLGDERVESDRERRRRQPRDELARDRQRRFQRRRLLRHPVAEHQRCRRDLGDERAEGDRRAPSSATPAPSWHAIGSGDFYGNGYSDILWQNTNGAVAIWEMDGLKVIGSAVIGNPGTSWHVVGSGDFYGDGFSDISVAERQRRSRYLGDGRGQGDRHRQPRQSWSELARDRRMSRDPLAPCTR